jgi:hypothetical protein
MALLLFGTVNDGEMTMTTHTPPTPEETDRYPETVGDCDDDGDSRQLVPEAEERDPEEAGYGYGV